MAANTTEIPFFSEDNSLHRYVHSSPAFYHTPRRTILDSMSDEMLSLISPVVAYWVYSLFFHILDCTDAPWINKFRIHDSAEVKSRNLVSRWSCFFWVILQQVVQTLFGYFWMDGSADTSSFLTDVASIRNGIVAAANLFLGEALALKLLRSYGPAAVWFAYWYAIPMAQLLFAMMCIDTWQYFLHRAFHVNKFLYRQFHSWHHRLYVPYAYGALYNHPLEGLVLDTVGAGLAHLISLMSVRQGIVLFVFSTVKTIDDHCGYRLSLDPLQMIFSNNADYHDIHHQIVGIKSNFAQPFFIHWDTLLGTRMTRKTMEERQLRSKEKKIKSS
ncbi:SUR2 [Sanghuangporus vaninii]